MSRETLLMWQDRLERNDSAYSAEREKMDARELLYKGGREMLAISPWEEGRPAPHVRNIIFELVEAQVSTTIPQPKVTARNEEDQPLAKLIEDMIRNELDRLPMETLNDMVERTVPIQGGVAWLIEWDDTIRSSTTIGEIAVSTMHPKQIVPQDGVYSSIEDMDYIILKVPQTKEYIRKRYDVDVEDESESEPDVKDVEGSTADDIVTQYIAYYRNDGGGIGVYSWVNDTELEDIPDYQARRVHVCGECGRPDNAAGDGETCAFCGGKIVIREQDEEELFAPIMRRDGSEIPGADPMTGEPTRLPYYKPNIYPVLLQRNVSAFGQLLGDSDVDKITDQQRTINRIEAKIIDRILKAGTRITLPMDGGITVDERDAEIWRLDNQTDLNLIKSFDFRGDLSYELNYLNQIYEEARQTIGITDSFQGRRDTTATSKVAKEFAAQQSAGRLESKRAMKNAAWAAIFEAIFKFKLAYTDEPRPVVSQSADGTPSYSSFSRYDFLKQDETGKWFYNDQFLFTCDASAPLANNREAMWQETRMNLQTGAYGDPAQLDTLILFWSRMEALFYPGAAEAKRYLEEKLQQQQAMMAQQQQMMQQQAMAQQQAQMEQDDRARRLDQISQRAAAHIHKLGKDMPTTAWADNGK